MADDKNIFSTLNQILSKTDLTDITADTPVYEELKDGYYLCEVETAELKVSSKGSPMAAMRLKVVENGHDAEITETGDVILTEIPKTKGRCIFLNFVLTDEISVKRFVTNMLKFEGDNEGEPILPKEAFTNADTIEEALSILVGMGIYVQVSTTIKNDGSKSTWNNLISWKRANALELPM